MGQAEYRLAEDGHEARVAHPWTEEKLRILSCYLAGFARACRRARGWYGIDLFAGAGLNVSGTTGDEIPGSPLRMLEAGEPRATRVVVAEQSPRHASALRPRLATFEGRCEVLQMDAVTQIASVLAFVEPRAPAFAFLDPEGADLAWSAVRAIAAHKAPPAKKIEQLILFPTDTGFVRLLAHRQLDEDNASRVTAMFGSEDWRPIWEARREGRADPAQSREAYVRLYIDGLRALGYRHTLDRLIVDDRRRPMYFLIFASDHDAGDEIMWHCFGKQHVIVPEELGQQRLFPDKVPRRAARR